MQLLVNYKEIQHYILREYKKEIDIRFVDFETFRLSYSPHRFLPTARITMRVDHVGEDAVVFSYNGKSGINMIIQALAFYMKGRIDENLINIVSAKKQIYLYPSSVKGISKAFEYLTPSGIYFTEEGVNLLVGIK